MKKRILAVLLMLCMVITIMPVQALAAGDGEPLQQCVCTERCDAAAPNLECPVCTVDPTQCAVELLRAREAATHTAGDIHEVDIQYLALCRRTALRAAQVLGWRVISCADSGGAVRPAEEIHDEIWDLLSRNDWEVR